MNIDFVAFVALLFAITDSNAHNQALVGQEHEPAALCVGHGMFITIIYVPTNETKLYPFAM